MDLSSLPSLSRHSTEALHRQIYQILLEQILAGKCAPEEKLPGMNLLAETFHVSTITISQALDQLIRDGYCFRRPKKGTFVASSNRRTNSPEAGTILLFSSHHDSEINLVDTPFYTGLRRSAEQTPQTNLLIIAGKHAPDQLAVQLKERERILGVILIAVENLSFALKLARSYPTLPFVLLNYQFAGFEQLAPSNLRGVFNDEFCGGYMAASRLFADGAKNIGILQYQVDDENYHLRVRGARQAHADHGIPFRDSQLLSVNAKIQPEERGYNGMAELIARNPHLDAVFFAAAGVCGGCRAIRESGCHPKVITFDEVPTTLEMLKDGIISATISQQPVRQGSRSLDILFEYLTSGILPEQEQNFVELSIKIRENI